MKLLTKKQLEDAIKCGDGDINCRKCDMQMDCIVTMGCLTCKKIAQTALSYRKILEKLEWRSFAGEYGFVSNCPMCGGGTKHEPDCELGQILKESLEEE